MHKEMPVSEKEQLSEQGNSAVPEHEREAWGEHGHPGRAGQWALTEVADELRRAQAKFGPIASLHEGYAVTLEELDEFWQAVKTKSTPTGEIRAELIQVAAMAIRTIIDCIDRRQ